MEKQLILRTGASPATNIYFSYIVEMAFISIEQTKSKKIINKVQEIIAKFKKMMILRREKVK